MGSDWQLASLESGYEVMLAGGWRAARGGDNNIELSHPDPDPDNGRLHCIIWYSSRGKGHPDFASALAVARRFAAGAIAEALAKMVKDASGVRGDLVSVAAQAYLDAVACPPTPPAPVVPPPTLNLARIEALRRRLDAAGAAYGCAVGLSLMKPPAECKAGFDAACALYIRSVSDALDALDPDKGSKENPNAT